jgi:hypothetical protein
MYLSTLSRSIMIVQLLNASRMEVSIDNGLSAMLWHLITKKYMVVSTSVRRLRMTATFIPPVDVPQAMYSVEVQRSFEQC